MNCNHTEFTSQETVILNSLRAAQNLNETEIEAAMEDLAPLMNKVCRLVERHPEWRTQSGPERVNNIVRELLKL